MGRKRSGAEKDQRVLDEPYPSSPTRPPKWGFFFRFQGKYCFHNYYSLYAAKKEIEAFIDGQSYKWLGPRQILCDNGLSIQSEQDDGMEKVIEYELTPLEDQWQVPEPMSSNIRRFLSKPILRPEGTSSPIPLEAPPPRREPRAPRPSKDGLVTIAIIAQDISLDPREARAALRALKIEKPDAGWAWPSDEAEKIKEQLRTYQK